MEIKREQGDKRFFTRTIVRLSVGLTTVTFALAGISQSLISQLRHSELDEVVAYIDDNYDQLKDAESVMVSRGCWNLPVPDPLKAAELIKYIMLTGTLGSSPCQMGDTDFSKLFNIRKFYNYDNSEYDDITFYLP